MSAVAVQGAWIGPLRTHGMLESGGLGGVSATDLHTIVEMIQTQFEFDSNGRIVSHSVSMVAAGTPRFLFARTRHGNTWRFRSDLNGSSIVALARYAGREAALDEGLAVPERLSAMIRVLNPLEASDARWAAHPPEERLSRRLIFRAGDAAPAASLSTRPDPVAGLVEFPWRDRPRSAEATRADLEVLGDRFDFY